MTQQLVRLLLVSSACTIAHAFQLNAGGKGQSEDEQGDQTTPQQHRDSRLTPRAKHIQYLSIEHAGIHDRLITLTWLLQLGKYHHATTHLLGGPTGANIYLHAKHSKNASTNWGDYFDLDANFGNPFHDVKYFPRCKVLDNPNADLTRIFDGGVMCVNITTSYFSFKHKYPEGFPDVTIPPSPAVLRAASRFRQITHWPKEYGTIHIRRCDLINQGGHRDCTAVSTVVSTVHQYSNIKTWFVELYAEPGYKEKLQEKLRPLNLKFLFEDEYLLNIERLHDNYFTLMVGNEIKGGSQIILDTHHCPGKTMMEIPGPTLRGQYLQRFENKFEENDSLREAQRLASLQDMEQESQSGEVCDPGFHH